MKVGIYTLGCKVNTYESNYVASLFKNKGYELVDFNDICDIYIINTCSVTNNSDHKSDKIIRQAIKKNKDACIVAMGCHME
jgi:threonylcarbamoyladenosine tRNA methylthiotransferase MtaB